jgi:hypothetical protein
MSAFLGKIHYWLYNKVLWHEALLEEIMNFGLSKAIPVEEIKQTIFSQYGYPDTRPLEEIIDHGNIHGWLQSKIQSVEYRLAAVITEFMAHHHVTSEELVQLYKDNGLKAGKTVVMNEITPEELFNRVFDFMLAGMPCDRVHETTVNTETEFSWQTTRCLHKDYWDAVDGDIQVYYVLQDAWITGFIKAIDESYSFVRTEGGLRTIRKGQ